MQLHEIGIVGVWKCEVNTAMRGAEGGLLADVRKRIVNRDSGLGVGAVGVFQSWLSGGS